MDGVLADFNGAMVDYFGVPFDEIGTSSEHRWELITNTCPDVYSQLRMLPDADELVAGVIEMCVMHDYVPAILTAIPKFGRLPDAVRHKKEWIRTKWPVLHKNFNIGPYAVNKQDHATPSSVLIDDSPLNIPQWNAAGGHGILHTSAAQSLEQLTSFMEAQHVRTA
jgi:5'(3')-deoxyribonucleotidase